MTDTSAAELDATNAPGLYSCDVTQGETNADKLLFSGKSSTANVKVVPSIIYTRANNINDMVIDSSGILDVRLGDYPHGGNSATITLNTLETSTLNVSGGVVTITTMEITTDLTIGDDLIVTGDISATTNSLPWNAAWDAEVQSEAQDAITASSLPTAAQVWAAATRTLTALDEDTTTLDLDATITAAVPTAAQIATAVLTTAMTEAYRTAGGTATLAQAVYELIAHMGDSVISGTTKTLRKLDGTTAKTFTLDSASTPASITEAT